jgi:putative membrane protein
MTLGPLGHFLNEVFARSLTLNTTAFGAFPMNKLISAFAVSLAMIGAHASAQEVADMSDVEFAHIAYTADNIDIRYAYLALALSQNPDIHDFANTMIRDHTAVNEAALGLLDKLGATAQDNPVSQSLNANAEEIIDGFVKLRGAEFDAAYAANELAYHQAVNDLVENTMIPNIDNAEVKALFVEGLEIFKAHETHAEMMVKALQ